MSLENSRLYEFGPFVLDVAEHRLLKDGQVVPLANKVFNLLLILVEAPGHLKTRQELIDALWPDTFVEEHSLTARVSALRRALGDEGEAARYIETVRAKGYRFIAPVRIEDGEAVRPPEESSGAEAERQGDAPGSQAGAAGARRLLTPHAFVLAIAVIAAGLGAYYGIRYLEGRDHRPPTPPAHSIAVLPFENLSASKNDEYFARGIQDTILTKLSGVHALRVISRTSSETYTSHPQNLKEVARQLDVAAVLEGSVQKADDQVLINVQLIDAGTDNHLWAQSYTRKLNDIFGIENDVAEQVTTALKAKLLPGEKVRIATVPTKDARAYDLFLKAEYLATQSMQGGVKDPARAVSTAADLYRRAIARDPRFALAYARLSHLESFAYWFYFDHSPSRIDDAERAARQALKLAPDLPQAHVAMGYVDYWGRQDYTAALEQFEIAHQALPNDAGVTADMAFIYRRQGKWRQALAGLTQAGNLDPRNPRWPEEIGITQTVLRHYTAADASYDRTLAIKPDDYNAMARKIASLFLAGKIAGARQVLAQIPAGVDPQGLFSAMNFQAARLKRDPDAALAALRHAPAQLEVADLPSAVPKSLLRAYALTMKGDNAGARKAYAETRDHLREKLKGSPREPGLWSLLGLAETGLADKAGAVRDGRGAVALLPVSRDAFDGPAYLNALAKIYARLGMTADATNLLHRLLAMPAGQLVSVPMLKLDPTWDPIRRDPAFQALIEQYSGQTSGGIPPPG